MYGKIERYCIDRLRSIGIIAVTSRCSRLSGSRVRDAIQDFVLRGRRGRVRVSLSGIRQADVFRR